MSGQGRGLSTDSARSATGPGQTADFHCAALARGRLDAWGPRFDPGGALPAPVKSRHPCKLLVRMAITGRPLASPAKPHASRSTSISASPTTRRRRWNTASSRDRETGALGERQGLWRRGPSGLGLPTVDVDNLPGDMARRTVVARYRSAPIHSSTAPSRPVAGVDRRASSGPGLEDLSWKGPGTTPGDAALTRIRRPTRSSARPLVAVLTNPLEPADMAAPVHRRGARRRSSG